MSEITDEVDKMVDEIFWDFMALGRHFPNNSLAADLNRLMPMSLIIGRMMEFVDPSRREEVLEYYLVSIRYAVSTYIDELKRNEKTGLTVIQGGKFN